jgi:hypothetical protein
MLELAKEYGGDWLDFMKKYGKLQKKSLPQHISCEKVMEYIGHPVHRGQIFFQRGYKKNAEFYVDFNNVNLPCTQNSSKKKIFHNKGEHLGFSCFLSKKASNFEISFYRCILSLR